MDTTAANASKQRGHAPTMTDTMIDLGDGSTAPMNPPAALGAAFATVVAEAVSWDRTRRAEIAAAFEAIDDDAFYEVTDRIGEALSDANLDWSCQFGEEGHPPEAGPYIDTLHSNRMHGAGYVAAAVLARDLSVVTKVDFEVATGWWSATGLPLPIPRAGATFAGDEHEVEEQAMTVLYARYKVAGWPLAVVTDPQVEEAEAK